MSVTLVRLILSAALVAATACDAPTDTARSAAPAPATSASTAGPDAARRPKPDEEGMIVQALVSAGIRGTIVFQSKFDWLFGSAAPRSGTFQGTVDGTQVWADVHFLDTPVEGITACLDLNPTRETAFTVSVKGRPQVLGSGNVTGSLGSAGPMYFAASERVFVMTPDARVRDALRSSLALSVPGCIRRDPATLPVFPEEPDVVAALDAARVPLALIARSKLESWLGEPRRARIFIEREGQGGAGADFIFLDRPLDGLRVCVSRTSTGGNRYEIFVGGRSTGPSDGGADFFVLTSDRYVAFVIGERWRDALASGLALRGPQC